MGYRELVDSRFGNRVREERERRGWSQQELATQLGKKGITVQSSTIAKIESTRKPRAARLGEAAALADLFGLSVDELLGRQGPDTSTLTYALAVLNDYVTNAERNLLQLSGTVADIGDQLESVEESFHFPPITDMKHTAQAMADSLKAAHVSISKLSRLLTSSIAAPRRTRGQEQTQ